MQELEETVLPIFIGSKNRINFPMSKLLIGAYLFIEPAEYQKYKIMYGNHYKIVQLEKDNMGFAYLLNSMLEYAMKNMIHYFMFADDDILGWKTRDGKKCTLERVFLSAYKMMTDNDYAQVMVSFAGHNWYYKGIVKENIGAWCMYLNDVDKLRRAGAFDPELKIFNDWDMSATLIKAGFKTACMYDYQFLHKMKSRDGGAAEIYKQNKNMEEAADYLIKKYGEKAVRKVTEHGQTEVRFNWKKL